MAGVGQHRLGMELHAVHRVGDVAHAHDGAVVFRVGRRLELGRETVKRSCTPGAFRRTIDLGVDYTYRYALRSPGTTIVIRIDVDAAACKVFDELAS